MERGVAGDVIPPKRQKCGHRGKNVGVCYSAPRILSNSSSSALISIPEGGRRWLFEEELATSKRHDGCGQSHRRVPRVGVFPVRYRLREGLVGKAGGVPWAGGGELGGIFPGIAL